MAADDSDHLAGALGRRDLDKAATPTGRRSDTSDNTLHDRASRMKESCVMKWSPDNTRKTPYEKLRVEDCVLISAYGPRIAPGCRCLAF